MFPAIGPGPFAALHIGLAILAVNGLRILLARWIRIHPLFLISVYLTALIPFLLLIDNGPGWMGALVPHAILSGGAILVVFAWYAANVLLGRQLEHYRRIRWLEDNPDGTANLVEDIHDGHLYVLTLFHSRPRPEMRDRLKIARRLRHPALADNFGAVHSLGRWGALAEHVEGVSLAEFMARNEAIPENTLRPWAAECLRGVGALEENRLGGKRIQARDILIRPDNGVKMRYAILDVPVQAGTEAPPDPPVARAGPEGPEVTPAGSGSILFLLGRIFLQLSLLPQKSPLFHHFRQDLDGEKLQGMLAAGFSPEWIDFLSRMLGLDEACYASADDAIAGLDRPPQPPVAGKKLAGEGSPRPELFQRLVGIMNEINATRDSGRILPRILECACELLQVERGMIISPDREPLVVFPPDLAERSFSTSTVDLAATMEGGVLQPALAAGVPMSRSIMGLNLRSVFCLPMAVGRTITGFLYLDGTRAAREIGAAELELLRLYAEGAAIALSNAREWEEKQRLVTELEEIKERLSLQVADQNLALQRMKRDLDERDSLGELIGKSPPMQKVYDTIQAAAASDSPVLILGESGTGKELAARAVHQLSARHLEDFVAVNVSAVPEALFESEFFGYRKGAFTGAERSHPGFFRQAHLGTLFLDEVAEMHPGLQVKFLRVLEERLVQPLGETQTLLADFRLITATNRDISRMLADKSFREDLYYRMDVVRLEMPPLRQRTEDIPLILARQFEKRGRSIVVSSRALESLMQHEWPGNVRELLNFVERFLLLRQDQMDHRTVERLLPQAGASAAAGDSLPLQQRLDRFEQEQISRTLARTGGNKAQAARLLGMSRFTLLRRMEKYGLHPAGDE